MSKVMPDWVCPACGAEVNAKAIDCCDYCILTIFSGKHSPELSVAFDLYSSVSEWVSDPTEYEEIDNGI